MKTKEIEKVSKNRIGRISKNGVKPAPKEDDTFDYLVLYGFDIEFSINYLILLSSSDKT